MKPSAALVRRLSLFGSVAFSLSLAGCGVGGVSTQTAGSLHMNGSVYGGVQPITGASIQLFAVGTAGNGSQATSLLNTPVLTDSHSYFTLTGDYTCPSPNAQVYLVARGGNPGLPGNVSNNALVLLSALGNCGNLASNPNQFIAINEVSTVAAVYGLAQFISGYDHIGATATNGSGIANAFLDAQLLANTATGMATQLPSNLSVETGKLYALADVIVPCVNSNGGSACTPLFTAATLNGTAPTDVLGALLNIVRNPGHNVAGVFNVIQSTPPYPTSVVTAPHDWTMSLSVTGGGLVEPTQLAVDGLGNVWVTNYGDPVSTAGVSAFSPQGTPLAGTPFGAGLQSHSYGLTLDKNGDVWASSYDNVQSGGAYGSVAKFQGASSPTPGALVGQFYDATLSQPQPLASDPAGTGTILIGNFHTGTVTFYDLNGAYVKNLGQQIPSEPNAVTSDNAGGAWVGDFGDVNVAHLRSDNSVQLVACCNEVNTINLDLDGNVWTSNFVGVGIPPAYTFSEVSPSGVPLITEQGAGGLYSPGGGAIDAGGQFWVANYYGAQGAQYGSFSEIAGNHTSVPVGTGLSPTTGFGLDAKMSLPYTLAPDPSGNIWVSVRNGASLRMFFGLATPTLAPATPIPQAP